MFCLFCLIELFIIITIELFDQAFSFFFLSQLYSLKLFHYSFCHNHFLLSSTFFVSPSPFFANIFLFFYDWSNELIFLFPLCLKLFVTCAKFVWELKVKNMVFEIVASSWKQTKQVPKVTSCHNLSSLNECLWSSLVAFRHYRLCHEFFWAIIAFLPLWFLITCYNLLISSTKFLFAIVSFFLSHATWFWSLKFSTKDLLFSNDTILNQRLIR